MTLKQLRKTKIVCTIGPATQSKEMLHKLIDAGMNVMRMNFSHGDHDYHYQTIQNLRDCLKERNDKKYVAIMLDTKGPEIRTGKLEDGRDVTLIQGQKFTFYTDQTLIGDSTKVSVSHEGLPSNLNKGDVILVDDGLISFLVDDIGPNFVETSVQNNGVLGERKGINLPNIAVNLPAITEKDIADIKFGVEQGVDFVAASFVRKYSDIQEIRKYFGNSNIKIISKIESQEGMDNFDKILDASDGIMVARGDLGIEVPIELVFRYQKLMIEKCNLVGKPVIVATQMLESMIWNPRPTRAEAVDVANAVLDGADCVMLSGESAKGKYPIEAVMTMSNICLEAEKDIKYDQIYANIREKTIVPISMAESIASSAVKSAYDLVSNLIITVTESGKTAEYIRKHCPVPPVIAITANEQVARHFQVFRGIYPLVVNINDKVASHIPTGIAYAASNNIIEHDNIVIIITGTSELVCGTTDTFKIHHFS